jgi:alcohol dehydrogenase class IV
MVRFTLEMPGRIVFGPGSIAMVPELCKGRGRRLLVISGSRWFEGSATKGRVEKLLTGLHVDYISCREGEPTTDSLAEIRHAARSFSPDMMLAVGGGSVLDTAKALSALLPLSGPVDEYLEGMENSRQIQGPCIPWIAVPTTAGTGAEATKNAVLKSPSLGVKRSIRSPFLLAYAVAVDPELSIDLPLSITGISGLDALTQLVEAYVTRGSVPPVRALIRDAFPLMLEALEKLPQAPMDIGLRSDAAYGALVSGIALANAGLGAAHGFAGGIGGAYDIPHGLLCAIFLPLVLEANAEVTRGAIGELVGERARGEDPVAWLAGAVRGLLGAYKLPLNLIAYGIPRSRLPELAGLSSGSSMKGNPRELSGEEKERILSRVI